MTNTLVQILVDVLKFLNFTDDQVLDPDIAVAELEAIAFALQSLDDTQKSALIKEIVAIGRVETDPSMREFVVDLPGNLGIL